MSRRTDILPIIFVYIMARIRVYGRADPSARATRRPRPSGAAATADGLALPAWPSSPLSLAC